MLYSVVLLSALTVVEAVERTNEVACDTSYTVKLDITGVLLTSAARADIADDTGISAQGIAVNGVVDSTVSDTGFLHTTDYFFKCRKILERVAVKLDVADVTGICELVIGSLDLYLLKGTDRIVNGYVEGVGVVVAVSNAFDDAVLLGVHTDKTS